MFQEFLNEICYNNPYNPASNGNRLYSVAMFESYYSIEVAALPDGNYRLVAWTVID